MENQHANAGAASGRTQTFSRILRSPTGWPLEAYCRLDEFQPGFLRFVTASRPAWRHAVAMAVANNLLDRPDVFLERSQGTDLSGLNWRDIQQQTSAAMTTMTPDEIIGASFGSCPDGLVAAIAKLAFDPLSKEAFAALHAVFAQPQHRAQRDVLTQLSSIDEGAFEATMILDPLVVSPSLVVRVRSGRGAERFNQTVHALRRHCSSADDVTLAKAVSDLRPETSTSGWAETWLLRADQNMPAPPWPGDDGLVALTTGKLVAMAGRKTKTCIASRMPLILAGRAAYYLDAEAGAIACVARTTGGWLVTQIVGHQNNSVAGPIRDRILDTLEANGVPGFRLLPRQEGAVSAWGGFTPWHIGEFDIDELLAEHGLEDE